MISESACLFWDEIEVIRKALLRKDNLLRGRSLDSATRLNHLGLLEVVDCPQTGTVKTGFVCTLCR